MWKLNLDSIKIYDNSNNLITDATTINTKLNSVLSNLKNMQYLRLKGISGLSTMDFIGENKMTKLVELDLRGTSITDISVLENYAGILKTICLDNPSIDLTKVQNMISNLGEYGWDSRK